MLLVDHHEPEAPEGDALLHQRVGAHHQARLPRRQPGPHGRLLRGGLAPEQQLGAEADRLQQALESRRMLLGEELRGCHQGGLKVVLHRQQHREQGDDGLAGAHVAHQQAVHALR